MKRTFQFVADFEGEIPGQAAKDCGNYLLHDLPMAKYESKKYLEEVLTCIPEENLIYHRQDLPYTNARKANLRAFIFN